MGGFFRLDECQVDFHAKSEIADVWLEIKGEWPKPEEFQKASLLARGTGKACAVFHGLPGEHSGVLYCWQEDPNLFVELSGCSVSGDRFSPGFFFRRDFSGLYYEYYSDSARTNGILIADGVGPSAESERYFRAVAKAKQARFEHGDNPAPEWVR